YYVVVKNDTLWHPVLGSWSIAEWRYSMKEGLKKTVFARIKNPRSAEVLSGIMTGDFEDRIMRMEFGKMGLQHLMAISGFHFALIAMMFSMLLRWIAPPKIATGILIILLSVYFVVLGGSPSISRAWVMCFIALMGFVAEKPSYALNSIGVAILFILFYDPLLCQTLGFQFSMVTTASILLWYPIIRVWVEKIFQKRHLGQMSKMSLIDQHCYCLLSVIKEGVALAVAVNLTALPMTLHLFEKFPFLSLLYNLFIPFLVSVSMFLFIIAGLSSVLLPPLGAILHSINSHFTHFMLNFVYNVPNTLNYNWRVSDFRAPHLIAYLCIIFLLGIFLNARREEKSLPFAFI
ncbi:MAG: ComEC/Rec2 family competence protein, partial [Waddliaceae bacterium]